MRDSNASRVNGYIKTCLANQEVPWGRRHIQESLGRLIAVFADGEGSQHPEGTEKSTNEKHCEEMKGIGAWADKHAGQK